MRKIQKNSRRLSLLFSAICWLYPLLCIYLFFFHFDMLMAWAKDLSDINYNVSGLSWVHQIIIFMICAAPVSIAVFICNRIAQLFRLYEQGILFEVANIKLIKSIGIYMIVGELVQLIYQPLVTYALTCMKPAGQHMVIVEFGTPNFAALVTGFVIVMASWIIEEAHELQVDKQLTV